MGNIIILGASGHSKVIIDILHCMNKKKKIYDEIYLLDDNKDLLGTEVLGHKIIGTIDKCKDYMKESFVIAIGNNDIRKKIAEQYNLNYINVIHPLAVVAEDVEIDDGTIVMAGAIINSGTTVGKHCIINTGATVDHDNVIKDYVHISPGVHMGGTVMIDSGAWIGVGSCVRNNIYIGKNIIVGAGAVVVRDITEAGTYAGVPAKKIR